MKSETNIPGLKMLSQGLICWLGVAGWSIYFWHKVSSLVLCTLSSTSWKPQSLPRAHFTSWHSKVIQTLEHPWTNWLSSQSMSKCQTHLRIALNSAHENLSERRKSEQYGGKPNTGILSSVIINRGEYWGRKTAHRLAKGKPRKTGDSPNWFCFNQDAAKFRKTCQVYVQR